MTPQVYGIDMSLTATAVAMPDGATYVLDPKPRRGMDRILWIAEQLGDEVVDASDKPDLLVIEDYAFSRGGHAHEIGELGGVIKAMLIAAKTPYVLVGPTNLKRFALGKGGGKNTDKTAMGVAAMKRAGREFGTDDECDAWWLYAMGRAALGTPVVEVPQAHLDALTKVSWPTLTMEATA